MPTRNRRRVAATVAALGLAGMLFAVGADSMVAAGHQIRPEQTSSVCSTPTDEVVLTSVDQVAGLIDGTWIRCDGPPLFGDGTEGEVGVDVVGDRFYRVYRAADGSLIRAEGIDQEGALAILDTTGTNGLGSYQTNWKLLGQGTAIFRPSFFQSPSVMGLRMTGTAHYERWTGAAPTPGVPPGTGPSACGDRITPIALTSVAQAHDLLVGPWTHCAGGSPIGNPDGEAGLEFTADGRFRRLVRGADGAIVPGSGDGQEGTWTVIDTTSMNGPGWYQVSLTVDGRGAYGSSLVFFVTSPMTVRFVGMQGLADYVSGQPPADAPSTHVPSDLPPTGDSTVLILLISAATMVLLGGTLRAVSRHHR